MCVHSLPSPEAIATGAEDGRLIISEVRMIYRSILTEGHRREPPPTPLVLIRDIGDEGVSTLGAREVKQRGMTKSLSPSDQRRAHVARDDPNRALLIVEISTYPELIHRVNMTLERERELKGYPHAHSIIP